MIKKLSVVTAALLVLAALLPTLTGCSKPPELASVKDRFVSLIEESYYVNEIFFGEGLVSRTDISGVKTEVTEEQRRWLEDDDPYYFYSEVPATYLTDNDGDDKKETSHEQINTIAAIKSAAEKVYSQSYCTLIYRSYLSGETGAKYIERTDEDTKVTTLSEYTLAKPLLTEKNPQTVYDFDTMTIVKPSNGKTVIVEINAYNENYFNPQSAEITTGWHKVNLQFVKQNGEWFLDSPSY